MTPRKAHDGICGENCPLWVKDYKNPGKGVCSVDDTPRIPGADCVHPETLTEPDVDSEGECSGTEASGVPQWDQWYGLGEPEDGHL